MKIKGEKALKVFSVFIIVLGVGNILLSFPSMCLEDKASYLIEIDVFVPYCIAVVLNILGGAMEITAGTYACTIFQNSDKKQRIRTTIIFGISALISVLLANYFIFDFFYQAYSKIYYYMEFDYQIYNTNGAGLVIILLFIIFAVRVRFGHKSIEPEKYGIINWDDNDEDIIDN